MRHSQNRECAHAGMCRSRNQPRPWMNDGVTLQQRAVVGQDHLDEVTLRGLPVSKPTASAARVLPVPGSPVKRHTVPARSPFLPKPH